MSAAYGRYFTHHVNIEDVEDAFWDDNSTSNASNAGRYTESFYVCYGFLLLFGMLFLVAHFVCECFVKRIQKIRDSKANCEIRRIRLGHYIARSIELAMLSTIPFMYFPRKFFKRQKIEPLLYVRTDNFGGLPYRIDAGNNVHVRVADQLPKSRFILNLNPEFCDL